MRSKVVGPLSGTAAGAIAERVVGACVHCGMCNSACPTYRLTGDELDGPRGRIYLMKQVLEGDGDSALTQRHLDRCLECRACETACPSGVQYHRLLDIVRPMVGEEIARPRAERVVRGALRTAVATPGLLDAAFAAGRLVKRVLPDGLKDKLPDEVRPGPRPVARHARRMLLLAGCAQSAAAGRFNAATARVFARLGVSLVEHGGCCGAVPFHLDARDEARAMARRRIEAWEKALQGGCEAIVVNASGCAAFIRDWPDLFADDPPMLAKAERVAATMKDPIEILSNSPPGAARRPVAPRIALHVPCTLRNGPDLGGAVEDLLRRFGYEPQPVADAGQCCGSAGVYALFQPAIANRLRDERIAALTAGAPSAVFTANIGCWLHMAPVSPAPMRHWIEAIDDLIS